MTPPKQLTVTELISLLQALPWNVREMPVRVEGCDCYGDACGVTIISGDEMSFGSHVLIRRPDGIYQFEEGK